MRRLPAPADLVFDDLQPGDRFELGSHRITREEVIDFASRYDPQPWHLDDDAAAAHPVFDRLSASGWHTTMVMSGLLDQFWKTTRLAPLAGGGADEVRWLAPVYPDDVLTADVEIIVARASSSRPERGVITMAAGLYNQHAEKVASMKVTGIFARG